MQYTLANIKYRDQAAKGLQEPRRDADAPISSYEQEMNPLHDKDQQHFRRQITYTVPPGTGYDTRSRPR